MIKKENTGSLTIEINPEFQKALDLMEDSRRHVFITGFDKVLLSMNGNIDGLFLLVNGYFASKSRGWRCDWEREACRRRPFFAAFSQTYPSRLFFMKRHD